MFQNRRGKALTALILSFIAGVGISVIGCKNGGDTDGGTAAQDANGGGSPFVSDGGAGGSISIEPNEDTFGVGEIIGFRVKLRDADGDPIPAVRIFCESERGIAIIEPSSGGTSFENTDSNGEISGKLGGLLPGSFVIECRAPQGFNLKKQITLIITGEVPPGFQGFPGAAGGNLGGGVIIDETPDANDGGVRISGVQFNDAGTNGPGLPIDLDRNTDCNADGTTTTNDIEPFFFTNYQVKVQNDTAQTVFVDSIKIVVLRVNSGANVSLPTQGQSLEVASKGTIDVTGLFLGNNLVFAGTSVTPSVGTYAVDITINGTTEDGTDFSVTTRDTVSFGSVNNCAV